MSTQRGRSHIAATGVLLLLFALLTAGLRPLSLTADEPSYISGGYALWAQGYDALPLLAQRGYAPLLVATQALPSYLAQPDIPVKALAGWPLHYEVFTEEIMPYFASLPAVRLSSRISTVWLTMILAAIVYRWGLTLGGERTGLFALGLLALDPNILAHGRLATTDIGVTALGTSALYLTWRWTERPTWRKAMGIGILSGMTLLAKLSGLFWGAVVILIISVTLITQRKDHPPRVWWQAAASIGLAASLLWGTYGFTWGSVAGFPIPLPAPVYWSALRYLMDYESSTFLFGSLHEAHTPGYFPLAFLIKNPIPLLLAALSGLWLIARSKQAARPQDTRSLSALMVFASLYIGVAITGGMNIGYRHLMPLHPLWHLLGGIAIAAWVQHSNRQVLRRVAAVIGLGWYAIGTLRLTPFELTYFNELIGGPQNGYRYLADSNLAWGQTTYVEDRYLAEHPEVKSEPPVYHLRPESGRYIVDASSLYGLGISEPYSYGWFRQREPYATVKNSLLLFDVPPKAMTWVAQCSPTKGQERAPLLSEEDIEADIGPGLRMVTFACDQAWLYPGEGEAGIYAIDEAQLKPLTGVDQVRSPPQPPTPVDPFIARHLAQARFSFNCPDCEPGFALYESPGLPSPAFTIQTASSPPLRFPIALDGPLDLVGVQVYSDNNRLEIETWWRVTTGVIDRPFSIMAHLGRSPTPGEGEILAVADGAGVWPLTLRSGDIVVQRHPFPAQAASTALWLRTGAYWADSMERWACAEAACDSVLISLP